MAIKNIQIGQAGMSATIPSWVYINTNDTLATVTTAGYLNGAAHEYINTLSPNMMALVSTMASQNVGTAPILYLMQLQNVAGVWSLIIPHYLSQSISIPAASVLTAYASPVLLIPAPGAGKAIILMNASLYTDVVTTAFSGGGVGIVQYAATINGAGTNALSATIPSADITAASSQLYQLNGNTGNALTGISNEGIYFSNQTGAFTAGGSSSLNFVLQYYVVNASV